MADFDRNRSRYDEEESDYRSRLYEEQNRGAFGYEGEGYMRGAYGDPRWSEEQRYRGAGYGSEPGYRGSGYLGGSYGEPDYAFRSRRPSFRGRGPKNYQRSDERIREDVCEGLTRDERVDASDIEVDVKDAVVMLSGSVEDRVSKRRAEDVVESVSGVKDVQNQIRVSRERG